MRDLKNLRISAVALFLCLYANPAAAEETVPPLIEQYPPEELTYTIAPEARADTSSCVAQDRVFLDETAQTCWPLLTMWQDYIRLDFAVEEASMRRRRDKVGAQIYKNQAVETGRAIIAANNDPKWPLQQYLLAKTHERLSRLLGKWSEWNGAIDHAKRVVNISSKADFREPGLLASVGHVMLGKHLLAAGKQAEARRNYEAAFALFVDERMVPPIYSARYVQDMQFRRHTETMVYDAIAAGDADLALRWIDRYIAVYQGDKNALTGALLLDDLVSFKIYIHAALGDPTAASEAYQTYLTLYEGRRGVCAKGKYFPYVMAPLNEREDMSAGLLDIGCSKEMLAEMTHVPAHGIPATRTRNALPPHIRLN